MRNFMALNIGFVIINTVHPVMNAEQIIYPKNYYDEALSDR